MNETSTDVLYNAEKEVDEMGEDRERNHDLLVRAARASNQRTTLPNAKNVLMLLLSANCC